MENFGFRNAKRNEFLKLKLRNELSCIKVRIEHLMVLCYFLRVKLIRRLILFFFVDFKVDPAVHIFGKDEILDFCKTNIDHRL